VALLGDRKSLPAAMLLTVALAGACGGGAADEKGGPAGPGADFPSCGAEPVWYHTTPFGQTEADILAIEPLGHIIAPGHTWPSDHLYLTPVAGVAAPLPVRAPGPVRVWQIDVLTHQYVNSPRFTDYTIRFSPCRELQGYYHHVKTLVHPALLAALAAADKKQACSESTFENGEYQGYCKHSVRVDIAEGEVLATATGPGFQNNIDFGAYDMRAPLQGFANPARISSGNGQASFDYLHVACPLDAFAPTLRAALTAKLGGLGSSTSGTTGLVPRTAAPTCGTIMQDLPGTAQGIWARDGQGGIADSGQHLALVHDNFDPGRAVLASGGGPLGIRQSAFVPRPAGVVNRDFAAVGFQGGGADLIYCYEVVASGAAPGGGSVLLQMTSASSLQAEYRAGDCTAPAVFAAPVTYRR
jgi:hypothetical protein